MTRHVPRTDHDSDTGADLPETVAGPRDGHDDGTARRSEMGTSRPTSVPGAQADHDMVVHDAGHGTDRGTGQAATRHQADHRRANRTAHVPGSGESDHEPLVTQQRAAEYGRRWDAVKGGFVDEPRQAVAEADQIVAELLEELQTLFHDQRRDIEQGIDTESTSTEDLRLALRRYSSFFGRLLSV